MEVKHVKELERQLFWLKHENLGVFEDMSNVPNELICPITQEIFREPVICSGKRITDYIFAVKIIWISDGFCYERAAIDEWFLSGKISSPMTNLPMESAAYVPNVKLRAQTFCLLYGEP